MSSDHLEALTRSIGADGAVYVEYKDDEIEIKLQAYATHQVIESLYIKQLVQQAIDHQRRALGHVAIYRNGQSLLAVPQVRKDRGPTCYIFANCGQEMLQLGEPLAACLAAASSLMGRPSVEIRLRLLTELRLQFGRLPFGLYEEAYQLYRRSIQNLFMVLEPIMQLSANPEFLGIESWEALARSGEDLQLAPRLLLDMAGDWGDRFIVERDKILATSAITSFAKRVVGRWSEAVRDQCLGKIPHG